MKTVIKPDIAYKTDKEVVLNGVNCTIYLDVTIQMQDEHLNTFWDRLWWLIRGHVKRKGIYR